MAFWLIRRVLRNCGRVSLLECRVVVVLLVDMMHASCTFMMRVHSVDGGEGDGMAGMGLMRVACVILGSAPGVLARVLRR